MAHPPLLVIVNSDFEHEEEAGSAWSRRRKLIAGIFALVSIPLFWLGTRQFNSRDLFTFLAINCILLALRFLYWDSGSKHRERERRRRVEAHRERERGDA